MATEHTFRIDGFGKTETRRITSLKAIRIFCRECYGFAPSWRTDIEECPSELCPLHPFRFGKDPGKRPASAKQVEASRRNAQKFRAQHEEKRKIFTADG